jgi:hypothetical protein
VTYEALYYHSQGPYPPNERRDLIEAKSPTEARRIARARVGADEYHQRLIDVEEIA